ncbi:UbiA family prenyltransferase [Mesonia sp. K7]|uniref:UbiA family prenyltransferase n=1 Tax=Mesonia sp. K7 TaxID=2218606 RepID=UPI001314D7D7|nr:UbiA family prenyltransferase [Mesonia sp. K7]
MITFYRKLLQDLKISRPGLWFPTIWIYLVPFALQDDFWKNWVFWLGLFFVTFPLNYLVYGLNDYNDYYSDSVNQRKGNYLFGAKSSQNQLASVPKKVILIILPFVALFTFLSGIEMFLLLFFMIIVNVVYNFKPFRIKERPPLEILIQIGYVITAIFSVKLNNLPELPWQTFVYLSLFAFQAHIAGEIMDIEPDKQSGKKTTATILGRKKTKILMFLLLVIESFLLFYWFQDIVLSTFLGIFSVWLLLDVLFFFKDKSYTLSQMKFFGYAINLSAILSMIWVLYSGKILQPVF